jgi:hypothetical protein
VVQCQAVTAPAREANENITMFYPEDGEVMVIQENATVLTSTTLSARHMTVTYNCMGLWRDLWSDR